MQIKSIKIGSVEVPNNVFLAPLAGYSSPEMRVVCTNLGAGLAFTEMVSAKGLKYNPKATNELLYTYPEEKIKAVQLFGDDSEVLAWAAQSEYLQKFDIIDINMGCPVPKIFNNGEGSALLKDIHKASKIIESVAKCGKPVTVKFRIGIEEGKFITKDFAKMCEDSGASLITIHGRVRTAIYSGEVNFLEIEKAKTAVKIPVIANGGVFCEEDANILMERTGADGVMVARGAMNNPLIFSEITKSESSLSFKEAVLMHLNLLEKRIGSERCAVIFRKQMAFYLKGVRDSKKLKEKAFSATSASEMRDIILNYV